MLGGHADHLGCGRADGERPPTGSTAAVTASGWSNDEHSARGDRGALFQDDANLLRRELASFEFPSQSATRGSSGVGHDLLAWAEKEITEIEDYSDFIEDDETAARLSGELFHIITTSVSGEALQLVQNCDFSGAEAWRRLSKRYSPTTPLRAMQLMLQIVHPGRAKTLKDVAHIVDKWEARVHMLERDFKEVISSKMKAAILISILPGDVQDAVLQQADKYEEYQQAKVKVMAVIEAKLAIRSPDEMDVDAVCPRDDQEHSCETLALGKGGIYCYRCGGQGHIAAKCATPEPVKGGGKGKGEQFKGNKGGKGGKSGKNGKGKSDWAGYCSYCGKRGHGPKDCWSKERDEATNGAGGGLAIIEEQQADQEQYNVDYDLSGFEVAMIDLPSKIDSEFKQVAARRHMKGLPRKPSLGRCSTPGRRTPEAWSRPSYFDCLGSADRDLDLSAVDSSLGRGKITIDSGAAESVMPVDMLKEIQLRESEGSRKGISYIAANGGRMPNMGERKVHFKTDTGSESSVVFQVTHARKPLASVSKIVRKGNRVIFDAQGSYIENVSTGKRIGLHEENGTYHLDVEFVLKPESGFTRQA